jgi:hypothetical protein
MRMWMVKPEIMCDKHLLGEHYECHMFAGCIDKNKSLTGYIRNNIFDLSSLAERHNRLAEEMAARGFSHKSPLSKYEGEKTPVNVSHSLVDLLGRCESCRKRYNLLIRNR